MGRPLLSFPQRVYHVLKICEEQGREDIISWENDGTAFTVNDKEEFKRDLLPRYFNTKKYSSFARTLNGYGFTCVRTGRQPGIYSHPNFNRNDPLSPSLMRRVYRKNSTKVAIPNHDISKPSFEALGNRSLSPKPDRLNGQEGWQSPPDETGRGDDSDTDKVFGRSYHMIASQEVADRFTSLPVQISQGPELSGVFDREGDRTTTKTTTTFAYPTTSSSNTSVKDLRRKSFSMNERPFVIPAGSGPSSPLMDGSAKQDHQTTTLMPCHVPNKALSTAATT